MARTKDDGLFSKAHADAWRELFGAWFPEVELAPEDGDAYQRDTRAGAQDDEPAEDLG